MIWLLLAAALCPHPHRSRSVIEEWKQVHPCPRSCRTYTMEKPGKYKVYQKCGACQVDHICPLACCGADAGWNLQWLTSKENRQKSADCTACNPPP